jgi:hypothetical protein
MRRACWFADLPDAGPCDGGLVRCHLIRRQPAAFVEFLKELGLDWWGEREYPE